jgi:hypothetical protein
LVSDIPAGNGKNDNLLLQGSKQLESTVSAAEQLLVEQPLQHAVAGLFT